jgi:hypothetical protein
MADFTNSNVEQLNHTILSPYINMPDHPAGYGSCLREPIMAIWEKVKLYTHCDKKKKAASEEIMLHWCKIY